MHHSAVTLSLLEIFKSKLKECFAYLHHMRDQDVEDALVSAEESLKREKETYFAQKKSGVSNRKSDSCYTPPPESFTKVVLSDNLETNEGSKLDRSCEDLARVTTDHKQQGAETLCSGIASEYTCCGRHHQCLPCHQTDLVRDKPVATSSHIGSGHMPHHDRTYLPDVNNAPRQSEIDEKEAAFEKTRDGWKCRSCAKSCRFKQNMIVHLRQHTGEKPYKCKTCGVTFSVQSNYKRHIRLKHPDSQKQNRICEDHLGRAVNTNLETNLEGNSKEEIKQILQCITCGKVFKDKRMLEDHELMHSGQKKHTCYLCGKSFGFRSNLHRHLKTHSGEKPHHCQVCSATFIEKKHMRAHCKKVHGILPDGTKAEPEIYTCEKCGKQLRSKSSLYSHQKVHGQKTVTCELCGRLFISSSALRSHMCTHSCLKPWKCTTCGRGFAKKHALLVHLRIHTGEKPFNCSICEKRFAQASTLLSHVPVHTRQRNFICSDCGQTFLRKSHLAFHVKKHRTGPMLSCTECPMSFYRKYDLDRHKHVHTREKPYKCFVCQAAFSRKQYLNEHINKHTGAKPYRCQLCNIAFGQLSSLYKHKQFHLKQNYEQNEGAQLFHLNGDQAQSTNTKVHARTVVSKQNQTKTNTESISCANNENKKESINIFDAHHPYVEKEPQVLPRPAAAMRSESLSQIVSQSSVISTDMQHSETDKNSQVTAIHVGKNEGGFVVNSVSLSCEESGADGGNFRTTNMSQSPVEPNRAQDVPVHRISQMHVPLSYEDDVHVKYFVIAEKDA